MTREKQFMAFEARILFIQYFKGRIWFEGILASLGGISETERVDYELFSDCRSTKLFSSRISELRVMFGEGRVSFRNDEFG